MADVHEFSVNSKIDSVSVKLVFLHGMNVHREWEASLSKPGSKQISIAKSADHPNDTFVVPTKDVLAADMIIKVTLAPIGGGQVDTGYSATFSQNGTEIGSYPRVVKLDDSASALVDGIHFTAK